MKKLVTVFLTLTAIAFALNFHGHQSLNGLNRTSIFTAPASAAYFISGVLSLPQLTTNNGTAPSSAKVKVYKVNGSSQILVYTGVSGASGFGLPALALVTGDAVTVGISSDASIDQPLNAVRGEVYFGNAF